MKSHLLTASSGHEVDSILFLLHSLNVLSQACHLFLGVGRVESQQFGQSGSVGVVLHHTQLDANRK